MFFRHSDIHLFITLKKYLKDSGIGDEQLCFKSAKKLLTLLLGKNPKPIRKQELMLADLNFFSSILNKSRIKSHNLVEEMLSPTSSKNHSLFYLEFRLWERDEKAEEEYCDFGHALVVEKAKKLNGETYCETYWRVYQSWNKVYSLNDWLGNTNNSDPDFGRCPGKRWGKRRLTHTEIKTFMQEIKDFYRKSLPKEHISTHSYVDMVIKHYSLKGVKSKLSTGFSDGFKTMKNKLI